MNQFAHGSFEIFTPPASRRTEAITAVFGGSRQRAARSIERGGAAEDELLLAVEGPWGDISQAALLTRTAGRTAMLYATSPRTALDGTCGSALIQRAIAAASRLDARIVQSLVEPEHNQALSMFLRGGMRAIGTLSYLERPSTTVGEGLVKVPHGVAIRPWMRQERALLEQLLDETYIDSLDCPGLATMRPTAEILDGHLHTGIMHPDLWCILEVDGKPCGVSLASEIPSANCIELVYFGLAPRARGRGLAGVLLDSACASPRLHGNLSLALACDERNHPAMRLYESRGFSMRVRRTALVALAGT